MKLIKKSRQSKLADLGEFNLIDRILKKFGGASKKKFPFKIAVPNGDDAFAARFPKKSTLVITTDTLVEGTHFNFNLTKKYFDMKNQWYLLGKKAMAVNLSDLAAMGDVKPLFSFVTLGLSGDISVDYVDNFFDGIGFFLKKCGYLLAGGDVIRSDKSIISITIVGESMSGCLVQRNGAKKGHILMASGPLGLSSAGLEAMKSGIKSPIYIKNLVKMHLSPEPRMEAGKILGSREIQASSMIDTSDDLMTSLEILSGKSGVGFELNLDSIPIDPSLKVFSARLKRSPFEYILYGGEDYQLLFTVDASKAPLVKKKIPSSCILGKVKPKSFGIQIRMNGSPYPIKDRRFKHF